MSFFSRIFGDQISPESDLNFKFGRYTDAYKTKLQYEAWDAAVSLFEKKDFLEAYHQFFIYLEDKEEQNITWNKKGDQIDFEILQGSKKITGWVNLKSIHVETKVAKTNSINVGFLRRLVEVNYDLKYSRYGLDDDNIIVLVFNSLSIDGSPYKLYFALKELSTQADKLDDLLVDEFQALEAIDSSPINELSPELKKVKYDFVISEIQKALSYINSNAVFAEKFPGGIAYILLHLCYKLDYLVKPEGFMMESLERIHRLYFEKNQKKTIEKNKILLKEFDALLKRSKEEFDKEFYDVTCTFGITTAVDQLKVASFIKGELHNMDWYLDNNHQEAALGIPGYIVGYCQFNFAVPVPVREYFHLFYMITEQNYFQNLGFENAFIKTEGKVDHKKIKSKIESIAKKHKHAYPRLDPNTSKLSFKSIAHFARSYLLMIQDLDLTDT